MANSLPNQLFQQENTDVFWLKLWYWLRQPSFSYLMLFLLQLKVVWAAWQYRDLTTGDTSSYFSNAFRWFENFSVNILWSPLYTAFYGTLLFLSADAYLVTILHRLIIVFMVTLMVLALMRRLLPHDLAWLVGVWWAILPINFNTLYEVHLFAVIPVLAAWLLILYRSSSWTRGGAVAILLGASILVRNELIVATAILGVICVGWEIWLVKKSNLAFNPLTYWLSYGLPLLLAGLLCFFFYARSIVQFPELPAQSEPKHTLNMCQVYAFGYQQRYPGAWNKSPWTECYELMESHFGQGLLSLSEMLQRNPAAVLEHFLWNLSLTPNGLQVSLFNATSGTVNPDYAPVQFESPTALILSIITSLILLVGLFLLYRERHYWWRFWLKERALGWLAMLAVVMVTFIIIPTQRPRPSYLFSLSIFLMALIAMSIFIIVHHWSKFKQLSGWMPLLMVSMLFVVPPYYANPAHIQPRQLLEVYRRLTPFEEIIARPDTLFLKGEYAQEIRNYVGHGLSQAFDYSLLTDLPPNTSLEIFLDKQAINLLYVDEIFLLKLSVDPFDQAFLTSLNSAGWKLLAFQNGVGAKWMLLQKLPNWYQDPVELQKLNPAPDIGPSSNVQTMQATNTLPIDGLFIGHGWYPFETFGGETFRWVNNDAEIVVTAPSGAQRQLSLELESGPGFGGQPFDLQILDQGGQPVTTIRVKGREKISLPLPVTPHQSVVFRLHVEGGGLPTPNDSRLLNFRVFQFGWSKP